MVIKRIKVAWFLFRLAFKIRMMGPIEGRLYLTVMKDNIDLDPNITMEENKAFHKYLDQIEKGLDK